MVDYADYTNRLLKGNPFEQSSSSKVKSLGSAGAVRAGMNLDQGSSEDMIWI